MAYITKEQTAEARKIANEIGKKYGLKISTTMENHSTLNISIMKGKKITIDDLDLSGYMKDFIARYGVGAFTYNNEKEFEKAFSEYLAGGDYNYQLMKYIGVSELINDGKGHMNLFNKNSDFYKAYMEIEKEVKKTLNWFDDSDSMIDYFHTKFYFNFEVGKWNKPYTAI